MESLLGLFLTLIALLAYIAVGSGIVVAMMVGIGNLLIKLKVRDWVTNSVMAVMLVLLMSAIGVFHWFYGVDLMLSVGEYLIQ